MRGRLRRKRAVPADRLRDEKTGRYLIARWEEGVDDLDARLDMAVGAIERDAGTDVSFTRYHRVLDAKLFKAEVRLSDETLEDSIERGELRQTIMEMMAEAISRDMEEVVINGDTTSVDPFLAVMDGVLVQATSNVVDASNDPLSKDLLRDMLKTLPSEYLRDKKSMRFLTSVDADLGYRNTLAERATTAGDRLLEDDTPVLYSGVPVQPVPLFPENLGDDNDQTAILLCNPKNIHVGIWRQVRLESARDISEGTLKIVATLRFDVRYAEEAGVAKSINVQL
jgi:hypothetical protein